MSVGTLAESPPLASIHGSCLGVGVLTRNHQHTLTSALIKTRYGGTNLCKPRGGKGWKKCSALGRDSNPRVLIENRYVRGRVKGRGVPQGESNIRSIVFTRSQYSFLVCN